MISHLNNVANVGALLAHGLREAGVEAELVECAERRRLRKHHARWRRYRAVARGGSSLHVHYALFSVYLTGLDTPMLVHCHGSDVRNLGRPLLSRLTLPGLERARAVLVSTPDLRAPLEAHGVRARYLPNPVVIPDTVSSPEPGTVLLFARLDEEKGASAIIEVGQRLVARGAKVRTVGWGDLADKLRADSRGIEVLDVIPPDRVPALIERHSVVVGQMASGMIGVSELEAMAAKRPVVMHLGDLGGVESEPPVLRATGVTEAVSRAIHLLEHRDEAEMIGQACQDWVQRTHGIVTVVERLIPIYEEAGLL